MLRIENDVYVMRRVDYRLNEDAHDNFSEEVAVFQNVKRFLKGIPQAECPEYEGNSCALETGDGKCVFVGSEIISFTPSNDAPLVQLFSVVGNSDVPYPVGLSETDAYFFLDHVVVPRAQFKDDIDWLNAYDVFYDECPTEPKFEDMVVIRERELL